MCLQYDVHVTGRIGCFLMKPFLRTFGTKCDALTRVATVTDVHLTFPPLVQFYYNSLPVVNVYNNNKLTNTRSRCSRASRGDNCELPRVIKQIYRSSRDVCVSLQSLIMK